MLKHGKVTVTIETVTPDLAAQWLLKVRATNRKSRRGAVGRYQADMERDAWELSDQAVSFDEAAELCNGEQRLRACLKAGRPFTTLVMRGLPARSMLVIDTGAKRTTEENLKIAGHQYVFRAATTARRVLQGVLWGNDYTITDHTIAEFLARHHAKVKLAHDWLHGPKFEIASIRAPVVRALIAGRTAARVEEFCKALLVGYAPNPTEDHAALQLRFHIWNQSLERSTVRRKLYLYVEQALYHFLQRTHPKELLPATEEMFPIPDVRARQKRRA